METTNWQPWTPYPKQIEILDSEAFITGAGGSAGGSKSVSLLMVARRHKKSLIVRRTYDELKELIATAYEMWNGSGARYNKNEKVWTFPDGNTLEFGSCQYHQDVEKWRGRAHSFKGFDEVTGFSRETFEFITGWTRHPNPEERCRILVTFNPPTEQSLWVLEYFAPWISPFYKGRKAESGEIRWFVRLDGIETEVESGETFQHKGEEIIPTSRTFIRAALNDNYALSRTTYRQTLQNLPEPLRSQLLYGDMDIGLNADAWKLFPTDWVYAAIERGKTPAYTEGFPDSVGLDIARGGADCTVAAPRWAANIPRFHVWPGTDTKSGRVVADLIAPIAGFGSIKAEINVDSIGVGSSPEDYLRDRGYHVNAVNFGAGATDGAGEKLTDESRKLTFANIRAAAYWFARRVLDPKNGLDAIIPDDQKFIQELLAPRWEVRGSVIHVQSKDELKQVLGRSPDRMDAWVLALWKSNLLGGTVKYSITPRFVERERPPAIPSIFQNIGGKTL